MLGRVVVIGAMVAGVFLLLGNTGGQKTTIRKDKEIEKQRRDHEDRIETHEEKLKESNTLLLVLPSSVELPAKGELETDELIRLIEESHFLRCLEREEAREVFAEVAAPEQKGTEDRIIRVSLGKKIKPNLRKYMLMDVIAATCVQAQMEEIGNLSPTADLPGFV